MLIISSQRKEEKIRTHIKRKKKFYCVFQIIAFAFRSFINIMNYIHTKGDTTISDAVEDTAMK